ncbi:MAG: FixH family protein [Nitrospirales bacterium]|nr:FixH family protein [Nitrospirales bacterium]
MLTLHSSRFRWVLIGLAVGLLGAVLILFKESLWTAVESMRTETVDDSSKPKQAKPDKEPNSGMPSKEPRNLQATAMVSSARQQLIGVKTALVGKHTLQTEIRAVGKVEYDEQRLTHVNLRLAGWVEDLFVDYTGQMVRQGQPLFTLYSQELVAAQEEYLLAVQATADIQESPLAEVRQQGRQLVHAARDRLRLWTITDDQIADLVRRGTPQTYVTIYSPATGFVIDKQVFKGMYVKPEMTVYTIADLSTVWVHADVFEYEMPFLQVGQSGLLTLDAYPEDTFQGDITYIYPYLSTRTRTVKVRLVFSNSQLKLKPDMYGTVRIQVNRGNRLAVPEEAVLDSGTRTVVFVAEKEGMFQPREVTLGPKVGSYYEIVSGLQQDERIVTSGTFLLDSESKLMASTNMMGALGMGGVKMEKAHMGKMDMPGMNMNDMDMSEMDSGQMEQTRNRSSTETVAGEIEKHADGLTFLLSTNPSPMQVGKNRIQVALRDEHGKPVTNAQTRLTFTMPGMHPATISMSPTAQGTYEATVDLGMAGRWDLSISIQRAGHSDLQETFSLEVDEGTKPGMSGMPGM